MEHVLDLRSTPPEDRAGQLLGTYRQLQPGAAVLVITDAPEPALLEALQAAHAGDFEWHPLLEGPDEWRTVVARRSARHSPHRQVLEFMESDHRRIHALLGQIIAGSRDGRWDALPETVQHLSTGLRRHIQMEEELLFPVITEQLGTPRGPAAVLREEHGQALELVARLGVVCASPHDARAAAELSTRLRDLLTSHCGVEERVLYAVTDLLLSPEERDALVQRCQRVSSGPVEWGSEERGRPERGRRDQVDGTSE